MKQKLLMSILSATFLIPQISVTYADVHKVTASDLVLQAGISAAVSGILTDDTADLNADKSGQQNKSPEEDFSDLVISESNNPIFIYKNNSLNGTLVGMLPAQGAGYILAEGDMWYLIRSGYYTGFVNKENLITGDKAKKYADKHYKKEASVSVNTAFAYQNKDCTGAILNVYAKDTKLNVKTSNSNSYATKINGVTGYISSKDIEVSNILTTATEPDLIEYTDMYPDESLATYGSDDAYNDSQVSSISNNPGAFNEIMNEIVEYAMQFLGNPYVWGGESLTDGCDCSGFVMKIYEHFGYSLPHSSYSLRSVGLDVCGSTWDASKALPGDIICFDGHVGIYTGNGEMINASNPKDGIKISKVTARKDFVCARRIVSGHADFENLSETEYNELCRIVEAEAGGEPIDTRIAITDVILNRVTSSKFPNNIHDVIFSGNQFSPISNGRYYKVTVSASTKQAVNEALNGPDHSMGALYFMNPKYSSKKNVEWFYGSLQYLFSYGDVEFFR